jgi:ABC-type transport system involved in cytochrome c biogenesis permease subunit
MKSIKAVKKFSEDDLLVDLVVAFVAALTAALFTSLINALNQQHLNILTYIKFILLAVTAYSAIALLLNRCWTGRLRRIIPNWILIAVWSLSGFPRRVLRSNSGVRQTLRTGSCLNERSLLWNPNRN